MNLVKMLLILPLLVILSGCVHYPSLDDVPEGTPDACLDYQRCLYYVARSDMAIDCSLVFSSCEKARTWDTCADDRPDDMKFQECWDKLR